MCYLIMVATPEYPATGASGPLRIERLALSENSGYEFGAGMVPYAVTHNGCSCDLIAAGRSLLFPEKWQDELREKLRRKGWTAAKIARALAGRARAKAEDHELSLALSAHLREVIDLHGRVEVIAHAHHGEFEAESFGVHETITVDCSTEWSDVEVRDDVRYVFVKTR